MSQNQNSSKPTDSNTVKPVHRIPPKHTPQNDDEMLAGFADEEKFYDTAPKKFKKGEGITEPMPTVG